MYGETCGIRKPGWEYEQAFTADHIQCVRDNGHEGDHVNALGDTWAVSQEWKDAYAEVLAELIWALADQVTDGTVTLDTAAQIYAQTSAGAFDTEYAKGHLTDILAEEMLAEMDL
ncbi:hypothetical protein ABZ759_02265 [Streptomyces sp. NPDC047860]|uniref:hypothetical protein n=1 Tax=Streptomyces sp. NPDC047860 TaxID=3155743 RepID=UPI003405BA09